MTMLTAELLEQCRHESRDDQGGTTMERSLLAHIGAMHAIAARHRDEAVSAGKADLAQELEHLLADLRGEPRPPSTDPSESTIAPRSWVYAEIERRRRAGENPEATRSWAAGELHGMNDHAKCGDECYFVGP